MTEVPLSCQKFLRTRLDEAAELAGEPWAAGSPHDAAVREAAAFIRGRTVVRHCCWFFLQGFSI
jgi:hypothetical protein